MKLIHLTDPHLVAPPGRLCGLEPDARLEAAVAEMNRAHPDAEAVVLTGDLSYHGGEAAYRRLREVLAELTAPWHLLLGNHDDRAAFRRVFPETPVDADGFIQYVVPVSAGVLVMLDTAEEGTSAGMLCPRRLAWLEAALAAHRDRDAFVFLHHPPFALGVEALDRSRLAQGEELAARLAVHGRVRHLFYGHVHRPVAGSWRGIPATGLPGTNHQVALDLRRGSGSGLYGTHEPPAYGICLVDADTVTVHYKDFLDASPRFALDGRAKAAACPGELAFVTPEVGAFL